MKETIKPYKEPNLEKFLRIFILTAVISGLLIWVASLMGCSIGKKISKAYENAAGYEPQTTKDTANAIKIAKKVVKPAEVIYKPGKTVKVPYPVEKLKKVIDNEALKHITDSLEIAHAGDLNNVVDDCLTSVKKARNEGIKAGYAQAGYEDYINGKEVTTDSLFFPDSSTILLLDECELNLRKANTDVTTLTAQRDIYKGQAKRNFWLLILLGAGLLTSVFFNFNIKKSISDSIENLKKKVLP
jgi:hypothetical protein